VVVGVAEEYTHDFRWMEVISKFDKLLAEFSGWVVFVMMFCISFDVGMRYLFDMPTTWAFEVSTYMMVLVVFLSAPWTLPADGHVNVDILIRNLSDTKRAVVDVVTSLMAAVYLAVFTWQAWRFTYEAWEGGIRSTQYLAWPLWPMRMFLVIGGFFLMLEFIFRIIRNIRSLQDTPKT
jgi:TRAP-type mannitol/chloroaromatic compound transport system permease small subunit